ncbi:MAG: hypothetical protein ACREQJ_18055 [Candidatus Binatia bacterium]
MKRTLTRFLFFVLSLHTPGYAMTSEELTAALKKQGADEVALLEAFPVEIEAQQPDFLGGARYLRVSVLDPHHPHLLHYVAGAEGNRIYRLKLGQPELERMQKELAPEIENEEMALRYVQWVLQVSEGPAFWLLSSVKDVPFQPVAEGEEDLAKEIAKAKKQLASKISAPKASAAKDGFTVTQEAVRGLDLVRYEAAVAKNGRTELKKQTLVSELPVVYVLEE